MIGITLTRDDPTFDKMGPPSRQTSIIHEPRRQASTQHVTFFTLFMQESAADSSRAWA